MTFGYLDNIYIIRSWESIYSIYYIENKLTLWLIMYNKLFTKFSHKITGPSYCSGQLSKQEVIKCNGSAIA